MKISAIFGPTIQGEGKSIGKEVMFVRLVMCNLHCIWCDTPYTWNWVGTQYQHPEKFIKDNEVHEVSPGDIFRTLQASKVKSVVISGGEPFLQQDELIILLSALKAFNYWVEIETNGTIKPKPEFLNLVDQINCSPKLSNSKDKENARIRKDALRTFALCTKTNFKFVVSSDNDIPEILSLVKEFDMKKVYLMPEGTTKEVLEKREKLIKQLCNKHGFKFSPRLHITELGGGRLI